MRIDKFLAHAGYGTRAEVKKLLKSKAVKVDGETVKDAKIKIDPNRQQVTVAGEVVFYREYVYLMLYKPQNYLSATTDHGEQTVLDLVRSEYGFFDLVPVGRLDKDTEGLMLLTNDGQFVHAIISPKKAVYKRYEAHITGELTEAAICKLQQGIEILDGNNKIFKTKPAKVNIITQGVVEIAITEGKFHQVKRMFAHVGCRVTYLKRLAIGSLELDKTLPLGGYRELTAEELAEFY